MRFIFLGVMVLFTAFMLQSLGRTLYVHYTEFKPAAAEWHAAHDRGDAEGMRRAYEKERQAHARTIDPFWFLPVN